MGTHPINLGLRFLLEIAALTSFGMWGWSRGSGLFQIGLAITLPLLAAIIWGTFAVQGDPSRSGMAPIPVWGIIRLSIELLLFTTAVWLFYDMGYLVLGKMMAVLVIIHYFASIDRIIWLLKQK